VSWYLLHHNAPTHSYTQFLEAAELFISKIKNCDKRDKIQGCFINPTDCDDRTVGDTGRSVSRAYKHCAEVCGSYFE
jgi:hypothetical protein